MSKVLAIIQARLGSERLPNKVLLQIPPESGVSMLEMVIRKTLLATLVDDIAVVTPDKKLAEIVDTIFPNILCCVKIWKGRDVLREFNDVAYQYRKQRLFLKKDEEIIYVRLTGDCPLIQPQEIDRCINVFLHSNTALVYNTDESMGQLAGEGSDVEVFNSMALAQAFTQAKRPEEREHMTLWIRQNCKTLFSPSPELGLLSVNTEEDYKKVCEIVRKSR